VICHCILSFRIVTLNQPSLWKGNVQEAREYKVEEGYLSGDYQHPDRELAQGHPAPGQSKIVRQKGKGSHTGNVKSHPTNGDNPGEQGDPGNHYSPVVTCGEYLMPAGGHESTHQQPDRYQGHYHHHGLGKNDAELGDVLKAKPEHSDDAQA